MKNYNESLTGDYTLHNVHNILTTVDQFVSEHFQVVNLNKKQNKVRPCKDSS